MQFLLLLSVYEPQNGPRDDNIAHYNIFVQEIQNLCLVSELKFIIFNFMISNWHHPGRLEGGRP